MTPQETLQFNKKCAKFLGLKKGWWIHQEKPLTDDKKQWWDIDGKTFLGTRVYYDKDLQFHSDWNWIMEVLNKIELLGYVTKIWYKTSPEKNYYIVDIFIQEKNKSFTIWGHDKDKISATIKTINQFLIWYIK